MKKKNLFLMIIAICSIFFISFSSNSPKAKTVNKNKSHIKWKKIKNPVSFPILMYHSISDTPGNRLCIPPKQFAQQMKLLHQKGFYTLTPDEAYRILTKQEIPTKKHNKLVLITFDDGYKDNYLNAYPVLKKYSFHASLGVITSKVGTPGMLNLRELKKMHKNNLVSLSSHTVHHIELNTLNTEQQLIELADSRGWLNRTFKQNTSLIVYPVGRYSAATPAIAKRAGYKLGFTTKPGLANIKQGIFELHRQRVVPNMSNDAFYSLLSNN